MPIKTLLAADTVRYPRLGVIRLGVKIRNAEGKEYPREVDYFVLPPELREAFRAQGLSEKPTELDVTFPSDDPAMDYPMWFTRYAGPYLAVRCDGQQCTEIDQAGQESRHECWLEPEANECRCRAKALGRLNIIVKQAPALGCYQVLIGGLRRNRDLMTELLMNRAALEASGHTLSRAWFSLARRKSEVQVHKAGGGRVVQIGYPVHLLLRVSPGAFMSRMLGDGDAPLAALPPAESVDAVAEDSEAAGEFGDTPESPCERATDGPGQALTPERDHAPPESRHEAPRPAQDGWDLSLCEATAVRLLDITARQYRSYVRSAFKQEPELLSEAALDDCRVALTMAEGNEQARRTLRQTVLLTINKAKRQEV